MNKMSPVQALRRSRTSVAILLAYLVLFAPLAPVSAQSVKVKRAPAPQGNPQPGKGKEGTGGSKNLTLPSLINAPAAAPVITATKVDSPGTPASPGDTINYTVTISNTGSADATNVQFNDTIDVNTTLVPGSVSTQPIANADAYNVIGNVRIQPNAAQGLLANDCDPDNGAGCTSTGLTVTGPTTGPSSGQATVNATGSFSYNPNPGFSGTDSFTYTVTDGQGKTDTATVTLTVSAPIWFIDDSAAANGDGRLTAPFNCYTGTTVATTGPTCFSASAADDPGDAIFLYEGSYLGGYALLANQKLVGQAASSTLASIHGVTVEAYSDPLPATAGVSPVITTAAAATNAVPVSAGGITLRGFTVGATTGAKIFGNTFGTLTAGNNTTPDLVLSGAGQALNLTNGTFAATSGFTSVATTSASGAAGISLATVGGTVSFGTTSVSGAGAQGINIAGSSGSLTFGTTTVSSSATQGILIGTTTGNVTFGATAITGGTDGVSFQNNSAGTRTFASLSVSNNNGVGFLSGAGGGNVTVTGATLFPAAAQTAPTGSAIDIQTLAAGTTVSFGATTVSKGNSGTGVSLGSVSAANGNAGSVTFSSLAVTTSAGIGLFASNNTGQLTVSAGSIASTGLPAINIFKAANPASPVTLGFTTVTSTNSATHGVNIDRVSGNLTVGTTTTTNPTNSGIIVQNSGAGTLNFGNTSSTLSGSTGVSLGGATSGNSANITFADLDITTDAGVAALVALNNTGTITTTSGDIAVTGATAIDITGPAGRTPLAMVLNNVDSTNSAAKGVNLNLVSGTFTVNDPGTATNIQNPTGVGIDVQSTGAGTVSFGNTIVNGNGNTGVSLVNNASAINFGSLDITPDAGQRGLLATDSDAAAAGAITVASGTITTTNNTGVEITGQALGNRTPLNIQFTKVQVTGGSAPNGIRLANTSASGSPGGFRVLGTGGTCTFATPTCTGGQIANTTGADGATGGTGVRLDNADTVVLTRMRLNDHPNYAIKGVNVNGFKLDTSVINGTNGTNPGAPFVEGSVVFDGTGASPAQGLVGLNSITNSDIRGGRSDNLRVDNSAGTMNLTVSGNTFRDTVNAADAGDNIFIEADTTATILVSITGSTFGETSGDHINISLINNSIADVTITGNTTTGAATANRLGQGIFIFGATWDGACRYNISNNTMSGTKQGHAIHTNKGSGNGNMQGTISGNTIGVAAVAESGASESSGITVASRGAGGSHTAVVSNNQIHQIDEFGINLEVGEDLGVADNTSAAATSGPAATLNVTVTGNTVDTPGPNALHGIHLNSGIQIGDNNVSCVDIGGAGGLSNNVPNSANEGAGGADIRPRQRQATRVNLPGYGGTPFDNAAVNAYMAGRNNTTTVTTSSNNATGTANDGFFGGAACTQPTAPTLPTAPPFAPTGEQVEVAAAPSVGGGVISQPFISLPQAAKPAKAAALPATQAAAPAPQVAPVEGEQPPVSKSEGGAKQTAKNVVRVNATADTVSVSIGTLKPGDSVQITFSVTVNAVLPNGTTQVSNQGTVSGTGFSPVLTDDTALGGASDPTITPIATPPAISIHNAKVAEPASGTQSMLFTVSLDHPTGSTVTVHYATADQAPGAGHAVGGAACGDPGADYQTSSNTLTFTAGQTVQTIAVPVCSDADTSETDETFLVNLDTPVNSTLATAQATGTITVANPAGTVLISELRTSGPGGAGDDFVEVYNNTASPITVTSSDGSAGWGLYKSGSGCAAAPILVGTIPNSTVIPARGHYLFVGSQYTLANYGGVGNAAGNLTMTSDLESDANVALFSTANPANISSENRYDAVGFAANAGNNCDLLREGAALQNASGSLAEHSFFRKMLTGFPQDTNDNAGDFQIVSTTPAVAVGSNSAPSLGAPGPENKTSPILRTSTINSGLLDPCATSTQAPNRARDLTSDPVNNSTAGTLTIRRQFTNNTGANVTRLRFRIVDVTTFPAPGVADLRARNSVLSNVAISAACGGGTVPVQGLTLEQVPNQAKGGGYNSTLAAGTITSGTPLVPGATINVQFLLGLETSGTFRFLVIVEALP